MQEAPVVFVLAPALTIVYGLVRLLDGLDGQYGPGFLWTLGHFAFLVALFLFGFVVIEVVTEAGDGFQAVAAVRDHRPDVALLDIRMPGMDGIEAARIIGAETDCRVVMLTTFDQDDRVFDALRAGASGFLLKDMRRDDLVHAVRVVAKGESLLAPSVTRRLVEQFTTGGAARPLPAERLSMLTSRERETLRMLAEAMSNPEIAVAMMVSTHAAKTHVSNVLTKLGLRDRVQAVIAAYETGLVVPGQK